MKNQLLAALPAAALDTLAMDLELVPMLLGETLYEAGVPLRHAYFPATSVVSLHYITESGASAETSAVGHEGMVGIPMFMSGGGIVPFYFIAAMVTPTKPVVLERVDREEQQFWQGVRASPARAARDIRSRMKDIDRRLADIESYVTTENRSLAREIEQLR